MYVNKRVIVFLSILSLSLSTLLIPATAAAKAGAKCNKAGITSVAAGKTFTCVKSGKKLVWNKGVANVKSTKPAAPTGFNDLEANYSGVSYSAWKKSNEKILASSSPSIPLEILLGANTKLNNKNPEFAFSQVNKLYAGNVLPKNIVLLAFNFQDRDWAITKMDQIVPNAGSPWIKDVACPSADRCLGGGSFHNMSNKTSLIVITTGIDPNNLSNTTSGTFEAHEYTHSIQQSSADALRPGVNLLKSPWPPNWYWEGLANFSQHAAIYSDSFEKYTQFRKQASGGIFYNPTWNAKYIEGYFQTNLTKEWDSQYPRWRQYDLGAMLVEVLVAIKGPDSVMQVFSQSVKGDGFESAFQKIYGSSFQSVLPIISRTIALQLGN
jgi:hypothetical protein